MLLQQVMLLHSTGHNLHTCAYIQSPTLQSSLSKLPCPVHYLSAVAAHIKLVSIRQFYAHFKFAHNKWNENESFYTWLRWKRWHSNEEKTLLRVSGRDFSNKRLWGAAFASSCSCWHISKERIWLRVMEVEENTSRSPPPFCLFLFYRLNLYSILNRYFLFSSFLPSLECLVASSLQSSSLPTPLLAKGQSGQIYDRHANSVTHCITWCCWLLSFCQQGI